MSEFLNQHILITGGVKGIGLATVEVFVKAGGKVSILDIDRTGTDLELGAEGKIKFYLCDVGKSGEVKSAIDQAIQTFGDIHVLVNNAGINPYATVTDTSEELWDRVMDVNLKSAFLTAKYCIPSMMKQGSGVVVNVSSVQAFISQSQVAAYTTAKTALLGLTRSIAVDYAPAIRCVAVCPGTIDTPMLQKAINESPDPDAVLRECEEMHLVGRIGKPEEVADFIAYLASEKAGFITGQVFRIDGGLGVSIGGSKR
jgi:NAD(P)-dependent dehydrogenase (short-subunit alcohol dehydrogenase family)